MNKKSKLPWVLGTGGLVGGCLATWIAPASIKWYFTPPAQFGFNCAAPIEWALVRFQWAQLSGIVVGMIIALVAYFKFRPQRTNGESLNTNAS